jgi:alkyl sulfatase BDS1-like metallo-beta-lactamase superfamily hydrolase
MSNATLTNIKGFQAKNPDLTITINRSDLEKVLTGESNFDEMAKDGTIKLEGDPGVVEQLKNTMVQFELGFEIMPGTKKASQKPERMPFEQAEPPLSGGE